ncbi:MAG: DUF3330 domain-containing protein [Candidatus Competibacteraceae bacterium]
MPEPDRPIEPPKVQCHTCSKEIPPDADEHREGDDYTLWFCGTECYEQWRKTHDEQIGQRPA